MRLYVDAVSQQLRSLISPVKGIEHGKRSAIASIPEITGNRQRAETYIIHDIHLKTLDELRKQASVEENTRMRQRGPNPILDWHKEGF